MSERDHSGFPAEDAGAGPTGAGPTGGAGSGLRPADRLARPARIAAAALTVGLLAAALGGPYALIWSAVAPDIPVVKVDNRVAPADPAPEQLVAGDGWFAILGLAIGVVAALAAWWIARRHRGPLILAALAAGCVVAGVFASWLGQQIGLADYHRALAAAAPGAVLSRPPDLRIAAAGQWLGVLPKATGVQLVAAFAAVVTYILLAGWSRHPQLHSTAEPAGAPASGYPPGLPPFGGDAWPARYDAWRPSGTGAPSPPNGAGAGGAGPGPVSSDSSAPPAPPTEPVRPGRGEGAPPRD